MINTNDLADYFLVLLNKRFAYTACFTVLICLAVERRSELSIGNSNQRGSWW
jgi:hypothetical protein